MREQARTNDVAAHAQSAGDLELVAPRRSEDTLVERALDERVEVTATPLDQAGS